MSDAPAKPGLFSALAVLLACAAAMTALVASSITRHPRPILPAATISRATGPVVKDPGSLRDLRGARRTLSEFQSRSGCVIAFLGVDCPIANRYVPRLLEMYDRYAPKGVEFVAVYPHESEDVNTVAAHALDRSIPFSVIKDYGQALADELGVTRVPEFCFLGPNLELLYRGRMDDQYGITIRQKVSRSDLMLAIDEAHAGKMISVAETPVDGCLLERASQRSAQEEGSSYAEIAPIMESRCAYCHHESGQAPFALTSYDDAVRWAEMIREVVIDRRMPPWHADPRYGEFSNDRRLTPSERDKLLAWIDSDMPAGEQASAIAINPGDGWSIGEPDVVVVSPDEFEIPAQGVIEYRYSIVPEEVTEDLFAEARWLQAAEMKPTTLEVTHHLNLYFTVLPETITNPTPTDFLNHMVSNIVWAPGETTFSPPEGTAMWIPQGARLMFEAHYTPYGVAARGRPRAGLIFADDVPDIGVRTVMDSDLTFKIPPHDPHYTYQSGFRVPYDVRLLAIAPHLHLRGKASSHQAILPDGSRQTILSIPRWDFEWHTIYWFKDPLVLPAGTRLETTGVWDNSEQNPANPDPSAEVVFGQQSSDEMLAPIYWFEIDNPQEHMRELFLVTGSGQPSDGRAGFSSKPD